MGARDNFAEALAEATAEVGSDDEQENAQSVGEQEEESTEEESEEDEDPDAAGDEDGDEDEDEDESDQEESGDGGEVLEAVRAAFDAGDLAAAAKALGVQYSGADAKAFAALRTKARANAQKVEARAAAAKAELADMSEKLNAKLSEARATYGDPIAARKAFEAGDAHAAGEYIEKMFGADLSTITLQIAQGKGAVTPESRALKAQRAELAKERAELEKQRNAAEAQRVEAQRRDAAVRRIHATLKHPFIADEDDARELVAELDKHWDPTERRFKKTPKEVADSLLERDRKRALKRGLVPGKKAKTTKPSKAKQRRPPPKKTVSRKDRLQRHSESFRDDLAAALRESGIK